MRRRGHAGRCGAVVAALASLTLFPPVQPVASADSVLSRIQRSLRGGVPTVELEEQPWSREGVPTRAVQPCSISVDRSQGSARLANGFVELEVDLQCPNLRALRSDPAGNGRYGRSLFASGCGFALERQDAGSGRVVSSCCAAARTGRIHRYEVRQTPETVELTLFDVLDDEQAPVAREQWCFALHRGDRALDLRTNGTILQSTQLTALRHAFALTAPSVYGLYDRGVVQMMRADASSGFYASRVPLSRAYMLGGDGAHGGSLDFASNDGIAVRLGSDGPGRGQTVLVSDRRGVFTSTLHSGEHLVTGGPFLVSPSQAFYARVDSGALVVYRYAAASGDVDEIVWQSGPIWPSRNDMCTLVLQEDSNLVLYAGSPQKLGKVLWSSHTKHSLADGNTMLYLDDSGRLLMYPSDHIRAVKSKTTLWSSLLTGGWRHTARRHRSDFLRHGEMLDEGGAVLVSSNGVFAAGLERGDNHLQLAVRVRDHRDRSVVAWASDAPALLASEASAGAGSFVLQDDGNAVLYLKTHGLLSESSAALWHSGSHGETRSDYFLQMHNDGRLVLGAGEIADVMHKQVWTSGPSWKNRLRAGQSMDARMMLLSNDLRFVAALADDQEDRAGLSVLFFDGTEYLTVSSVGASSAEKPCEPGLPVTLLMQEDGNLVLTRDEPVLVQHGNGELEKQTESVVVWASDTHGHPGMSLTLRDDGSLAIGQYSESDELAIDVAWSSAGVSAIMKAGESLEEGYCLLSPSGEFSAIVEAGGRLVLYRYSGDQHHRLGSAMTRLEQWCVADAQAVRGPTNLVGPTVSPETERNGDVGDSLSYALVLQLDGNLVFVRHQQGVSEPVFSSGTVGEDAAGTHLDSQRELILTDRGDLQLIDTTPGAALTVVWTSASDPQRCATSASLPRSDSSTPPLPFGRAWSTHPAATALQRVIVGEVPADLEDQWSDGWVSSQPVRTAAGLTWSSVLRITPNSKNFPLSHAGSFQGQPDDFEALMVGIWATAVGCLATADNAVVRGQRLAVTSPTLAAPSRGYLESYSFFDPDTYFTLSALLVSGDGYLLSQAREILEFSANHQSRDGQLPHHFVKENPQFQALSGATQSGPSIFWVLSALQYVKYSADMLWLQKMLPRLRHATDFCIRTLHRTPGKSKYGLGLVLTNGSLLIDTFIRGNFSSDTNAMLAGFLLPEMADAEESTGNSTGAHSLRLMARRISDAINGQLWYDSHFVTQLNPDGALVDMVDYDSNFIAVAGGVAADVPGRPAQVMQRIDNGGNGCAAWGSRKGGPQWVSERWYGPDRTCLYLKNTGDSWCGMARIAYFDGLSRIATGRSDLLDRTLDRLARDMLANTWLPERYGCSGDPQRNRTAFFFEYPSVIALMVAQMRYGIRLGLRTVSIRPSSKAPSRFLWHVGRGTVHELRVSYSQAFVGAVVPGVALQEAETENQLVDLMHRDWTVHGMSPKGLYTVDVIPVADSAFSKRCEAAKAAVHWKRKKVLASADGVVRFAVLTCQGCEVQLERRRHGLHVDET